jgi:NTP pyrophosphatase (non-canonical NTP hydrolase)
MDINNIQNQLQNFASERDWEQFHTPKNIAMALSVECSELVEIFQWLNPEESKLPDKMQLELINNEVADIAMYLLRFCDLLGLNLENAIQEKLVKNAEKYPINLSKGNAKKYNRRSD